MYTSLMSVKIREFQFSSISCQLETMEEDPFRGLFGAVSDPKLEELRKAAGDTEAAGEDREDMEVDADSDEDEDNEVSLDVVDESEAISR